MANVVMSHFTAKSATPFMAVLAIVWMGPALLAQSLIKDPVDEFRLWLGAGSSGDRPVKIREALMAMKSAGEVGRTLLLPDWQGQYRDGINKDSFEATVKRFVELARVGLQSREPLVQRQTARIIAEAGSINSGAQNYTGSERSVSRDSMLRASFSELQKNYSPWQAKDRPANWTRFMPWAVSIAHLLNWGVYVAEFWKGKTILMI